MKRTFLALIGGLLFLGMVSCGGGTGETASNDMAEENADATATSETEEPAMEEPDEPNIVELAQSQESLSTLVQAVQAAGLVETLSGEGPFTVFAPTNEAFDALPEGTLDNLLKPENQDQLKAVLTYHVVASEVMSTDLSDGMAPETVQGAQLEISIQGGGVMVNEANVVTPDVEAGNGVVHVIDKVMLPPDM